MEKRSVNYFKFREKISIKDRINEENPLSGIYPLDYANRKKNQIRGENCQKENLDFSYL